eukprot:439909_1
MASSFSLSMHFWLNVFFGHCSMIDKVTRATSSFNEFMIPSHAKQSAYPILHIIAAVVILLATHPDHVALQSHCQSITQICHRFMATNNNALTGGTTIAYDHDPTYHTVLFNAYRWVKYDNIAHNMTRNHSCHFARNSSETTLIHRTIPHPKIIRSHVTDEPRNFAHYPLKRPLTHTECHHPKKITQYTMWACSLTILLIIIIPLRPSFAIPRTHFYLILRAILLVLIFNFCLSFIFVCVHSFGHVLCPALCAFEFVPYFHLWCLCGTFGRYSVWCPASPDVFVPLTQFIMCLMCYISLFSLFSWFLIISFCYLFYFFYHCHSLLICPLFIAPPRGWLNTSQLHHTTTTLTCFIHLSLQLLYYLYSSVFYHVLLLYTVYLYLNILATDLIITVVYGIMALRWILCVDNDVQLLRPYLITVNSPRFFHFLCEKKKKVFLLLIQLLLLFMVLWRCDGSCVWTMMFNYSDHIS